MHGRLEYPVPVAAPSQYVCDPGYAAATGSDAMVRARGCPGACVRTPLGRVPTLFAWETGNINHDIDRRSTKDNMQEKRKRVQPNTQACQSISRQASQPHLAAGGLRPDSCCSARRPVLSLFSLRSPQQPPPPCHRSRDNDCGAVVEM